MKDTERCRSEVKLLSQLNQEEQESLLEMQNNFRQEFMKEWPNTLFEGLLPYKKIQFINGEHMRKFVRSPDNSLLRDNLYVAVFFMRAGK